MVSYIQNPGFTKPIIHNNKHNLLNEINWKSNYDGKIAKINLEINNNGKNKHGQVWWLCKCDCGNESIVLGYNLPSGHTKSCGKC